jgi:serine/threonine-protein kinase RsbW
MSTRVYNLTVSSSIKALEAVRRFVSKAAAGLGFDEHNVFEIEISVYEACANIIEHAYRNDPNNEINIKVVGDSVKALITITDYGTSFPQNVQRQVDITKFIENRQDGGLGIYIIEACMDEIKYKRGDNTNVLELVKYKRTRPEKNQALQNLDNPS